MNVWVWRTGKMKFLEENTVLVQLCPPQIPPGLACDWTHTSAVTGRLLNAWSMARPSLLTNCTYQSFPFIQNDALKPLHKYIYVSAGWHIGMICILVALLNNFWKAANKWVKKNCCPSYCLRNINCIDIVWQPSPATSHQLA